MDLARFFRSVRRSRLSSPSARIRSLITRFRETVHTRYNSYGFQVGRGLRKNSLAKAATDRFSFETNVEQNTRFRLHSTRTQNNVKRTESRR